MNSLNFPITIVDNFFDDPDLVVDFANSLEFYKDEHNIWPGSRTKELRDIHPNFYHMTINRFFNMFYKTDRSYVVDMTFQKVPKKYGKGWIHYDDSLITNIVYLTKSASINSGTTIYKPKKANFNLLNLDKKIDFYSGKIDDDEIYRKENNDQFEESVIIKNQYNRLFSFEGYTLHSANDFDDEERLTLIWFVNNFHADHDRCPISRMKTIDFYLKT